MVEILLGVPQMRDLWNDLKQRRKTKRLSADEKELFEKLGKALHFLANDPRHRGLQTHEISSLSRRYGQKVFQSYLGQGKHAWRMFWVYDPERRQITIIGLEPHPEDAKGGAYDRIKLSDLPTQN
jgi:hypothetical protein